MMTPTVTQLGTALRLFASIFVREVDERLLRQLVGQRTELADALGADPLDGLDVTAGDDVLEMLAVEYCRLFVGPHGHMPPVGSVVLGEQRFWGPSTEALAEFYRSCDLAPAPGESLLPDHISLELDCMAILAETGRGDRAEILGRDHLLRWLPILRRHVESHATLAFYPTWIRGLHVILEAEPWQPLV
jgi:TorA maturation chaperone TorD